MEQLGCNGKYRFIATFVATVELGKNLIELVTRIRRSDVQCNRTVRISEQKYIFRNNK